MQLQHQTKHVFSRLCFCCCCCCYLVFYNILRAKNIAKRCNLNIRTIIATVCFVMHILAAVRMICLNCIRDLAWRTQKTIIFTSSRILKMTLSTDVHIRHFNLKTDISWFFFVHSKCSLNKIVWTKSMNAFEIHTHDD